jgi:HTH-type transcriptional regulator / antitoxin HigA
MALGFDSVSNFVPDYAVPPGEQLAQILEEKGMSQAELATRTGRPLKTINEIVKGKAGITPETAIQLERALSIPATIWNSLEADYQLRLAQQRDDARLSAFSDWVKRVPVAELRRRGRLPETTNKNELIRRCLEFFGIDTPEALPATSTLAAFRKSPAFDPDDLAMCTWLRLGEMDAEKIPCAPFNRSQFRTVLDRLRALTRESDLAKIKEMLVETCRSCGVAVCFTSELPHTHVCGAARWLTPEKALIQLSCRYKSDDHFWFTFFHECAHILLHGKKEGFLEGKELATAQEEEEANAFASNLLIPRQAMIALIREHPLRRERILAFAEEWKVSPGIVLGQLQKHRRLPMVTSFNKLRRFSFDLTTV